MKEMLGLRLSLEDERKSTTHELSVCIINIEVQSYI